MSQTYHAPRGTADMLPEEQPYWRYAEQKAAEISALYGYERVETPVFEETGLFTRSVGENTDIVEKEMYTFDDRAGNSLTLRPEGTAPVCRAYLEHGMFNLPQPVKLFYTGSVFRYERPQAGRYRQHHQFGFEAIGDQDAALDAEVIDMAWRFFKSLGLSKLNLYINSIGCRQCRPQYHAALREYYTRFEPSLCNDCKSRLVRNPLRLLDCKQETCQQVADNAPKSIDFLCGECAAHFSKLKDYLGIIQIPFVINHRLVRGLDYYTRTVFEIQPEAEGGQSTIGGGGRYDDLIEELGGKPTPAIGFATGIERIVLNLKREQVQVPPVPKPGVFLAYMGDEARREAIKLAGRLRQEGAGIVNAFGEKSLKAQMRLANSLGVKYVIILGEEEVRNGTASVRDMQSAQQKQVPISDLLKEIRI